MNYRTIKRSLDIIFSLIGIIILSPLLIIVSVLIKIESKGPVIFKQKRIGRQGKVFNIYKFRSMVEGAEKAGVYELKGDSRVTKVGKVVRKTSIDELPQFLNILKGEMSIIGPRPTLTYHPWNYEEYSTYQKRRFEVKPGVTGLAQISGRKQLSWEERIEYDVHYVNNISFLFDMKILMMTFIKVIRSEDNINVGTTSAKKEYS